MILLLHRRSLIWTWPNEDPESKKLRATQSFRIYVFLYFCISVFLYFWISVFLYFSISVFLYFCISVFLYCCIGSTKVNMNLLVGGQQPEKGMKGKDSGGHHHTIPYNTTPYHNIPYHTIPYHTNTIQIPTNTIQIPYKYHTNTIPYYTIPYHTNIRAPPLTTLSATSQPIMLLLLLLLCAEGKSHNIVFCISVLLLDLYFLEFAWYVFEYLDINQTLMWVVFFSTVSMFPFSIKRSKQTNAWNKRTQ